MRHRVLFMGLLVALGAPVARAQQIPAAESGERIVNARLVNGQLELRDAATNAPICVPRGQQMIHPPAPADVRSTVTLQAQPTGADVIFTFRNEGSEPKPLTKLSIGIFTLGQVVTYHDDFAKLSRPTVADYDTYVGKAYDYPAWLYSPAWVINNDQYAIGVSVQFPILEYKHDVKVGLASPWYHPLVNGEGGRGWQVNFLIGNIGEQSWLRVPHQSILQPGETRTYVVSVRVTKNPTDWVRTLLPYRNYFRAMYGGVKYERHESPVMGIGVADGSYMNADNPRGFAPHLRPDRRGWGPFINSVTTQANGFDAVMFWLPTGLYYNNRDLNFPCQLGSEWAATPELATIFDQNAGMPGFARRTGTDVGFWWGRSINVAREWDPPELLSLDPDNSELARISLNDLDLAARAGATTIGLDTFHTDVVPIWKLYGWLERMRLRQPHIKFVSEPMVCDILHTLAPTFVSGWNDAERPDSPDGLFLIRNPNYLADFLLPGHEIWGGFRYNGLRDYFGRNPTAEEVATDMQRYADLGYRPCFLTIPSVSNAASIRAAHTWEDTVPADLLLSAAPEPFGPTASGSTHVALGTSSKPQRGSNGVSGGGDDDTAIAGSRPAKPSSSGTAKNTRTLVVVPHRTAKTPSVASAGSVPSTPMPTAGEQGVASTRGRAPTAPSAQSVAPSAADALRRWRQQMAGAFNGPRTPRPPAATEKPKQANAPAE